MFKIIPAIDLRSGKCVRLEQGDFSRQTTYNDNPLDVAKKWEALGAPLIHIVDLDGAKSGRNGNLNTVAEICSSVSCACELGGGIRTIGSVQNALEIGVSRVVFGTAVATEPRFGSTLVSHFNADCIVAGLDARDGKIATEGWTMGSDKAPVELAQSLFKFGIRQFIYTDISTDGMFTGPNLEGISMLCDAVPEGRFIASGGVGSTEHIERLLNLHKQNLDGVIVGKALYDGRLSYEELSKMI